MYIWRMCLRLCKNCSTNWDGIWYGEWGKVRESCIRWACTANRSACGLIVVVVHAGDTAAAPAREVEAIIRSPTNMAAADVSAVERRGHLALCSSLL